jgi:hypothetical protein
VPDHDELLPLRPNPPKNERVPEELLLDEDELEDG